MFLNVQTYHVGICMSLQMCEGTGSSLCTNHMQIQDHNVIQVMPLNTTPYITVHALCWHYYRCKGL